MNENLTPTPKTRVVVGLSGGVDSSVTAALLKQQGYEVIGVYMKNWNDDSPTLGRYRLPSDQYRLSCPWYDDYLDAKRVALQLDISFLVWDFRESYKTKVFDHFIEEFAKGRTPNPDVYCNSRIKFADFLERAQEELGATLVATGHYARIVSVGQELRLATPKDEHKDQTYFLYRLSQDQLRHALFPLAEYTKAEVRALAKTLDLPTKYKKDSQGICFIGDVDVREFVGQWLAPTPGQILDEAGRVIGEHRGVHLYTIGEKIAVDTAVIARLAPAMKHALPHYYVAEKQPATNTVVAVAGADHPRLLVDRVVLEETVGALTAGTQGAARYRHGGAQVPCQILEVTPKKAVIGFDVPQRALAPGQHMVLSQAGQVIGGGVIAETARTT